MGMHQALKKAHLSPPATGCQPSWAGSGIPRIPRPVWLWVQTGLRRCRGKLGRRRGPAALLCSEGWGGSRMWPLSCCLPLLGRRSTPPPAPSSSAAPAGSLPAPSPMPGPVTSVAQGTFSPAGHPRHQSCMEHRLEFQSPWQTPADLRSPQPRIRLSLLAAGPADLVGFRPNTREGRLAANFPPASGIV